MEHTNSTDQFTKSFVDFFKRLPRVWRGIGQSSPSAPGVPLVVRIGAAGHLRIEHKASTYLVLDAVMAAISSYAAQTNANYWRALWGRQDHLPDPTVRLVSQLAPGLDQLAAKAAVANGLELDVVLPSYRAAVLRDIQRTRDSVRTSSQAELDEENDPVHAFRKFLGSARRVFELDSSAVDPLTEITHDDYEQAANVILCNSALLSKLAGERRGHDCNRWT